MRKLCDKICYRDRAIAQRSAERLPCRVRTLQGLWLRDTFTGVWVSPEAIKFMDRLR